MSCRSSSPASSTVVNEAALAAPPNPSELLAAIPADLREQRVYAYIVTTIKTRRPCYQLEQTGSAPNFDGGRITLCTCKHKDRATFRPSKDRRNPDPWQGVWVAGLTSKAADPSRSLAYLMCVERSFVNQVELWRALPTSCRQAKSASKSVIGDLYEPKPTATSNPHDPANYKSPLVGHAHSPAGNPAYWYRDVMRWGRRSKPHRLLLGLASQSYRWTHTKMILRLDVIGHSAHHSLYDSLGEFIQDLQEFDP